MKAFLSTATGLAFSARAIGGKSSSNTICYSAHLLIFSFSLGAFGSAVLDAIINGKLASTLEQSIGAAAVNAGLPQSSLPSLLEAFATGEGLDVIPGANAAVLAAATHASQQAYANAYNLAWWSILPFVVIALIAVSCLKGVAELMTERVEASVERETETDFSKSAD